MRKVLTLEVRIGLDQDLGCSGVGERKETALGKVLEQVCTKVKGSPIVGGDVEHEVAWQAESGGPGEEDVLEWQHGVRDFAASKDGGMEELKQGGHRSEGRVRERVQPSETGGALDGDSQK